MNLNNIIQHLTILYLEDDKEVRDNIADTLSHFVKKVYSVSSVQDAIDIYNLKKPDIIISDIDMPGMNGIKFIKYIREYDSFLPIVILTAYKTEEFLLDSIPLHLEAYIVKPVSYVKLKELIQGCAYKLKDLNRINIKFTNSYIYNLMNKILLNENNKIVKLQNKEQLLLELLLQNINEVTYYYEIEQIVWEGKNLNKSSLKTIIGKLRQKLGKDTIQNEMERGYRLVI